MGDSSLVGEWCGRLIDESRSASCLCHACLRPPLAARRGPCCCPGRFKGRVPSPLVHPLCPLNHAGGHAPAGPTRFQRTCHGSFPFPDHGFPSGTLLVVGPPGTPVFHRTCPRATPWLSHLFPTEPSARVRSTGRLGPPGVRPGFLATSTGTSTGTFTASFIAVWTWR